MKTIRTFCKLTQTARTLFLAILVGLLGVSPSTLPAETVSDLLEQGIYSEETEGDLEKAVQLYLQVIEEAESNEALGARAQYRLGVCYWKQKDYDKASAAFEKILEAYPEQKELVRMASEYLAGAVQLLPAPWADGEVMRLTIKTPTGFEIGFVRYSVHSDVLKGQPIWRLSSQLAAGPKQVSQVDVVAESFKPLHCLWKHSMFGDAEVTYADGVAKVKLADKAEEQTAELSGVVYDNEQIIQLIRRLPLTPDYDSTLQVFTGLGGARVLPIETKVLGMETVKVPAGTFECYKVHMKLVNQTFWYSADEHRYLVKY
jgi:tetratricopeptide (TPR) repeat protein